MLPAALAALAGGGYWYLRNLIHTGNPLPWFDSIGPISLPAPDQALGGREGHSVLGYLTDGSVWSDWFLPGLHGGLTILWPLIAALAAAGCSCSVPVLHSGARPGKGDPALLVVGLTGARGGRRLADRPDLGFRPTGHAARLRIGPPLPRSSFGLGPAVLPVALLPRVARWRGVPHSGGRAKRVRSTWGRATLTGPAGQRRWRPCALLAAIAIGYPVQRHYLQNRYANPTFAAPGLNAAFKWADAISDARIATTSTRQYPLYGTDLTNQVQYIGEEQPHGGFVSPSTCQQWRRLLNEGHYDYVVTSRDRIEPGKPPYPQATRWTEGPRATPIFRHAADGRLQAERAPGPIGV